MNTLVDHTNDISAELFGDLAECRDLHTLGVTTPVLASPAAVLAGALVGWGAFSAGYTFGQARAAAEGTTQPH
ncbi:hypothetical protein ACK8GE_21040 [Micromonosporaceae bacterium DT194]|uniref:hypothetical protein n=1 Tax=Melissospora conviva TaxID=3388432 RepID=UPI003C140484